MPDTVLSTPPAGGSPGAPPVEGDRSLSNADASAEAYKAELPADLKLPAGVEIKYDDRDPVHGEALAEARTLAREAGLDQATFSKLLAVHARYELRQHDVEIARTNIERQSISGFEGRKSAMVAFLDRHLSSDQSTALKAGVHSRAAFEAIETLIAKATGRAAPISSTPSDGKSWADRMWPNGFSKEGRPPAGR
jgi:hypothetical protein